MEMVPWEDWTRPEDRPPEVELPGWLYAVVCVLWVIAFGWFSLFGPVTGGHP